MISELGYLAATFTAPENIGTNPQSMLWMFPLLAAIAIIYKATKLRIIHLEKFFKEAGILFCTLSLFMIMSGIGLYLIVHFVT